MKLAERNDKLLEYDKNLYPPFPNNLLIELTNACNHQCLFCENRKMSRKKGFIDSGRLYGILKEAYELGAREVGYYSTGEPFVHKDLVEFISKAKEIGFEYVYLTTNGALVNEKKAVEVLEAGLDSIKFSINAGRKDTYAVIHGKDDFDTVLSNLKYLSILRNQLRSKIKIFVSYVKTKQNKDEFELLSDRIKSDVDEIVCYDVYNQGGNMYEINEEVMLDKSYKPIKAPCYMLFNRIHITYEGYMNACCVDFNNYLVTADLAHVTLKEAWHSEKFVELRQKHLTNRLDGLMCYNCINNSNAEIIPFNPDYATTLSRDYNSDITYLRQRLGLL